MFAIRDRDSIARCIAASPGPLPEFVAASRTGVIMDSALGRHNFSHQVARRQADLGIHPDTISTDITPVGYGEIVYSLLECMAKFMALGYSLADVVRMTTRNAAHAIGLADELGAIAVGREADLSIIDVVSGAGTSPTPWRSRSAASRSWCPSTPFAPAS